jgi:quinol monooxygenase YgiN
MVIFQFHHTLKPEFIEAYKAAILEDARLSIQEEGLLRFEVFQDKKDLSHFSLLEVYRDMAAREFHLQTPYLLKFRNTVIGQEMLARKGEQEFDLFFPEKINK